LFYVANCIKTEEEPKNTCQKQPDVLQTNTPACRFATHPKYLLNVSSTPGSPLQFLAQCKKFWKRDRGKLEQWSAAIRGGGIPKFTQI
jgi:hypothetical protein